MRDLWAYSLRHYSLLDDMEKQVGFFTNLLLLSMNFKKTGIIWKLIVRATDGTETYVCYVSGNTPSECLELYVRGERSSRKKEVQWYVSKY